MATSVLDFFDTSNMHLSQQQRFAKDCIFRENLRCCHVRQGRGGILGEKSWVDADKLDRESVSEQLATALISAAYRGKPLNIYRN